MRLKLGLGVRYVSELVEEVEETGRGKKAGNQQL
jgi:hypothetical protein